MIPNPGSGPSESAPLRHDFKLSPAPAPKATHGVLDARPGP